jgi:Outer membrane protein beta-barrel domain
VVRVLSLFTVAAVLVCSHTTAVSAQEAAARNTISATAGALNFDLSGTGTTVGVAVRGTRALTPHIALETGVLFARPDLQGGGRATLFAPEVHLQYHWRAGMFAPYAGGGIGFGHQSRDGANATNLALSAAGGPRAYVTPRMAVIGEFRLRGLERDFSGTTAEVMGGLSFDLGR